MKIRIGIKMGMRMRMRKYNFSKLKCFLSWFLNLFQAALVWNIFMYLDVSFFALFSVIERIRMSWVRNSKQWPWVQNTMMQVTIFCLFNLEQSQRLKWCKSNILWHFCSYFLVILHENLFSKKLYKIQLWFCN